MRYKLAAAVMIAGLSLPNAATASTLSEETDASRFREVGRVAVDAGGDTAFLGEALHRSGWLILSPHKRRGYIVVESGSHTVIRSFDLDSLKFLRAEKISGVPIPGGWDAGFGGSTNWDGELVHAVDSEAGRIYLPMAGPQIVAPLNQPDAQRRFVGGYVLVIDEKAFDEGRSAFGGFTLPLEQSHLAGYYLMGLSTTRHHVGAKELAKVVAVFGAPERVNSAPFVTGPLPGGWDHALVQWNTTGVSTTWSASQVNAAGALPAKGEWAHVLSVCGKGTLTSFNAVESNNFQQGILATRDAVYTGCQSEFQNGAAVVKVALDDAGMAAPSLTGETIFPLAKGIGDTLADPEGGRLFVRTWGGGTTWWVFDAKSDRYTGSVAASPVDAAMGAGVDPGSGRFYSVTQDTCVARASGGQLPVRGGIHYVEARLDPVPASENIRSDLAYPSMWKIHVDPVTRRVFVRRGLAVFDTTRITYPGCEASSPGPRERFWRVFEDRIPVAERPGELDDSQFTTDVIEAEGVTRASYLGSGSGYGSRVVLTGGLDAATRGLLTSMRSLCGRDDREVLSGSVGKVEVSDQSTVAEAAALDADARMQEAAGEVLNRCRPQAPDQRVGERNTAELNRCNGLDGNEEAAFDEKKGTPGKRVDDNNDGCDDRTGSNRYAARCVGDQTDVARGFNRQERNVPRDGFRARVVCDEAHERAEGHAEGALAMTEADAAAGGALRVARSTSTVTVDRTMGKGVTVTVDSVARGIEIPGVGSIGVVRGEATSTATGRDGRAGGTYRRTICDVRIGETAITGCLSEGMQEEMVRRFNEAMAGRGQVRLRRPDPALIAGTPRGYLAAVQRDRKELFGDQVIERDRSPAVPALEIVLYQGDGGARGAGRQILQLAGVQASTSYGIVCLNGQAANGRCATGEGDFGPEEVVFGPNDPGEPEVVYLYEDAPDGEAAVDGGDDGGGGLVGRVVRLVRRGPEAVAQALRLLFNNPRELGLLAAVWALLYAPCWLGERRRSIAGLRARRAGVGGVA